MAIYKWREDGWTPGASTVAYRPLKTDYNDYSGNGYNLTANGGVSLTTIDGVQCAKGGTTSTSYLQSNDVPLPSGGAQRTISFWYREVSTSGTHHIFNYGEDATYKRFGMQTSGSTPSFRVVGGGSEYVATGFTLTVGNWYHVVLTYDGTQSLPLYSYRINGRASGGQNWTLNTTAVSSDHPLRLFGAKGSSYFSRGYLSEVIVDSVVWTDQQILNYFNETKSNYGYSYDAGVYWNQSEKLISLSADGRTWITIADRNLGATGYYTTGDALSQANCGNFYMPGNNYGFPYANATTTSSTRVDASAYGPGNYYNSSTFITNSTYGGWDTSGNLNLWGEVTNTNEARQGPCDSGWHVPSVSEWNTIYNEGITMGAWTSSNTKMAEYLKIPFAGALSGVTGQLGSTTEAYYWSSTMSSSDSGSYTAEAIFRSSIPSYSAAMTTDLTYSIGGHSLRAFKNTPVIPDNTWTVLYQPS